MTAFGSCEVDGAEHASDTNARATATTTGCRRSIPTAVLPWHPVGSRLSDFRRAAADIARGVHLFSERQDLVVDPRGREHHALGFLPGKRAGREVVLLP